VAYISLIALLFSVTNFVPLSAIGFIPIVLGAWRFLGRTYPAFVVALAAFALYALVSTLLYDPASLVNFEFYRRDGNFFIAYAPILAGCVYAHRWDLNKLLRRFFIFAVAVNIPAYAIYLAHAGLLSIFTHPDESFGSYFIARNAAGGFLAILFCLGIACYLTRRGTLLTGMLMLNGMMLFSTYSRGSMLGLLIVVPYLFVRRRWPRPVLATLIVGLIGVSLFIAINHTHSSINYLGYRFDISNPDEKVANLDIRYEWLWPRALAYFKLSPIVGMGFGSFDDQISSVVNYFGVYAQPVGVTIMHSDSHAHNSFLNILAELGVVGLFLMMRFYWELMMWAIKGAKASASDAYTDYTGFVFVELSSVCLLVMSVSEHRLTTPSNVLLPALAISLLLASRLRTATVTSGLSQPLVRTGLGSGPQMGPNTAPPAGPHTGPHAGPHTAPRTVPIHGSGVTTR
jgi:O-antigen ligase